MKGWMHIKAQEQDFFRLVWLLYCGGHRSHQFQASQSENTAFHRIRLGQPHVQLKIVPHSIRRGKIAQNPRSYQLPTWYMLVFIPSQTSSYTAACTANTPPLCADLMVLLCSKDWHCQNICFCFVCAARVMETTDACYVSFSTTLHRHTSGDPSHRVWIFKES